MDALTRLVEALRYLPGVGPKSAQRMMYHLLQTDRSRGIKLAECLEDAMKNIQNCIQCNNYTTDKTCKICQDSKREKHILCVVESPQDVAAIEQSHVFRGKYFVLMNKISPIDGIGPEDIGLDRLHALIEQLNIQEVILALSPTIEGQTTIHFIKDILQHLNLKITQLAHGIPSGGELEFLDEHTIGNALKNRNVINLVTLLEE